MSKTRKIWYKYLLNKYLIVGLIFIVWMTFFDQNSYFLHKQINEDVNKLIDEKEYFESKISKEQKELETLKSDPFQFERLARERYLMKKENEDIFVIEYKDTLKE